MEAENLRRPTLNKLDVIDALRYLDRLSLDAKLGYPYPSQIVEGLGGMDRIEHVREELGRLLEVKEMLIR